MSTNYVYIMYNPLFTDYVKIGCSRDPEKRRKQLSACVPVDYEIYATYETELAQPDIKFHKMIDLLNPEIRVSNNKEFFSIGPEKALHFLKKFAEASDTTGKIQIVKRKDIEPTIPKSINIKEEVKKPETSITERGMYANVYLQQTNHQGKRVDSRELNNRCLEIVTSKVVGRRQLSRYARLEKLIPGLKKAVDAGQLNVSAGAELSFLSWPIQEQVKKSVALRGKMITVSEAKALRAREKGRLLTPSEVEHYLINGILPSNQIE